MQAWKARLRTIGEVTTFDYDYMREGRRRPDPPPLLVAAHRAALHNAPKNGGQRVVLIGKSMGGRIGCHVALEGNVNGVICLGYPLCAMGDRAKLRDEVLRALSTPILFVQGTRDPLCPLDLLAEVRGGMRTPNILHLVEGGDHSLGVGKRELHARGQMQNEIDREILHAIARFLQSIPIGS